MYASWEQYYCLLPRFWHKQNGKSGKGLYELFSTKLPDGAQWVKDNKYVRKGGYSKKTENYIYVGAAKSPQK